MKLLAFIAVLALSSVLPLAVKANPKGLGPSAIEAARLKASPPPNYLAHYLPDDRYKIAGRVWKYVSTDLDTYYHLPASANMMRQPADRVIGFSSVRDAEEAGYVADPTDGTARQVAASQPMAPMPRGAGSGATITGSTGEETKYLGRVIPLLLKANNDSTALSQQFVARMKANQSQPGQGAVMPAIARQMMSQLLRQTRSTVINIGRISPPARYRRFHSLLTQSLRDSNNVVFGLNRMTTTGNLGVLMQMRPQMQRAQITQRQLLQEANRLGIGAQLQQAMGLPARVIQAGGQPGGTVGQR